MLVGAHYLFSFHKLHLLWWHELLMLLLFAICEQGKNIYKRNIYSKLSVRDIYTAKNMWCVNLVIAWVDSSAKRETRRVVLETYIQQKQAEIVFLFTFSIRVSKLISIAPHIHKQIIRIVRGEKRILHKSPLFEKDIFWV